MADTFVTMIGFAKRANKIVYGYDALKTSRKVKLLAVSDTASDRLKRDMLILAQRANIPLISVKTMEFTVGNNVKALGFTDSGMASAVANFVALGADGYKTEYGLRR